MKDSFVDYEKIVREKAWIEGFSEGFKKSFKESYEKYREKFIEIKRKEGNISSTDNVNMPGFLGIRDDEELERLAEESLLECLAERKRKTVRATRGSSKTRPNKGHPC